MIKKKIDKLRKLINLHNLDGYVIPKNDAYFSEFSRPDRLKTISNFTGSAGFAIVLKKENFLFVDGRYTIQAKIQSGKFFKILEIPKFWPKDILKKYNKKLTLGFDPQLFTSNIIKKHFNNYCKTSLIKVNFVDLIKKEKTTNFVNLFYNLNNKIAGESISSKINTRI